MHGRSSRAAVFACVGKCTFGIFPLSLLSSWVRLDEGDYSHGRSRMNRCLECEVSVMMSGLGMISPLTCCN